MKNFRISQLYTHSQERYGTVRLLLVSYIALGQPWLEVFAIKYDSVIRVSPRQTLELSQNLLDTAWPGMAYETVLKYVNHWVLGPGQTIKHGWSDIWDLFYQQSLIVWPPRKHLQCIAMFVQNFISFAAFDIRKNVWQEKFLSRGHTVKHFTKFKCLKKQCLIVWASVCTMSIFAQRNEVLRFFIYKRQEDVVTIDVIILHTHFNLNTQLIPKLYP